MRVLVTGGAGYIGAHCVRKLMQAGHDVTVYDNLSTGHRYAVPSSDMLIVGELLDTPGLAGVMYARKIEAVIHFAGLALVGKSVKRPMGYYENNVLGSFALLAAMKIAGVPRIVFSSSCATYGDCSVPISELMPQRPINPYGQTKLVVEKMLADYAPAYGISSIVFRYFNAAGASPEGGIGEDHTPETHLIPICLQVAAGRRDCVEVFGDDHTTLDGTCIRDYIHVDDLADAHVGALDKIQFAKSVCVNLGTGRGHSVKQIIAACESVTGRRIKSRMTTRRAGDPSKLVAYAEYASEFLGIVPKYIEIEPIIETAWKWELSKE